MPIRYPTALPPKTAKGLPARIPAFDPRITRHLATYPASNVPLFFAIAFPLAALYSVVSY